MSEIRARFLACRLRVRPHIPGRVAMQDRIRDKTRRRGGEIVAKLLQFPAQRAVIQYKPRIILDHPQRLARAVGIGIEDAKCGRIHGTAAEKSIIGAMNRRKQAWRVRPAPAPQRALEATTIPRLATQILALFLVRGDSCGRPVAARTSAFRDPAERR